MITTLRDLNNHYKSLTNETVEESGSRILEINNSFKEVINLIFLPYLVGFIIAFASNIIPKEIFLDTKTYVLYLITILIFCLNVVYLINLSLRILDPSIDFRILRRYLATSLFLLTFYLFLIFILNIHANNKKDFSLHFIIYSIIFIEFIFLSIFILFTGENMIDKYINNFLHNNIVSYLFMLLLLMSVLYVWLMGAVFGIKNINLYINTYTKNYIFIILFLFFNVYIFTSFYVIKRLIKKIFEFSRKEDDIYSENISFFNGKRF
jgi:hypothetical protein